MKFKTTQKEIRANYNKIICVPYCGLQNLLNYEIPVAYTVRREGWAADIYDMGGGVANCFCNITVKPYKGRKYNPAFVWVCVG